MEVDPAVDVEIISSDLKKECAGNYQMVKDIKIHDHPVWIKVKPQRDRVGYYQNIKGKKGSWIITDLENLKPMLEEQEKDAGTNWKNAFATSINIVEKFETARWHDGKHALTPAKKAEEPSEADADTDDKDKAKKGGDDGDKKAGDDDKKKDAAGGPG